MMPLQKSADKTSQADVYSVNYPVKPGPDAGSTSPTGFRVADTFELRILDGSRAKVVVPNGVKLTQTDWLSWGPSHDTSGNL